MCVSNVFELKNVTARRQMA